jgi:ketosteroid isomerase-like protein
VSSDENRRRVVEAFGHWQQGDSRPFFALVADDVRWTVIGSTPVSGTFTSKAAFMEGAVGPLTGRLDGPIRASVTSVLADGDHVVLQWEGKAASRTDRPYHQTYCWVMRFGDGAIREVTAYLDTELVSAMF